MFMPKLLLFDIIGMRNRGWPQWSWYAPVPFGWTHKGPISAERWYNSSMEYWRRDEISKSNSEHSDNGRFGCMVSIIWTTPESESRACAWSPVEKRAAWCAINGRERGLSSWRQRCDVPRSNSHPITTKKQKPPPRSTSDCRVCI